MKDISLPDDIAAIAASQKNKERDYWLKKLSGELVKCYFPHDYYQSGGYCRLTGHSAIWVFCHYGIQYGIRNLVANLVRVPLSN